MKLSLFKRNPTPNPVQGPNNEVIWPKFDAAAEALTYLLIQETSAALRDYRQPEYAFWTEYINYLMYGVTENA